MDEIKFLNPEDFGNPAQKSDETPEPLKAYVNKNKQLEFDDNAVKTLDLKNIKGVKFFVDVESQSDDLHIILCKEDTPEAFRLINAFSEYLVIGAENLFESYGYNPFINKIPLNLIKKMVRGQEVYKLEKIEEKK